MLSDGEDFRDYYLMQLARQAELQAQMEQRQASRAV